MSLPESTGKVGYMTLEELIAERDALEKELSGLREAAEPYGMPVKGSTVRSGLPYNGADALEGLISELDERIGSLKAEEMMNYHYRLHVGNGFSHA